MSARVQELFSAKIRKVVLAYEGDVEVKAIARDVGVSPPTVAKWLTEEGYKHKRKGRVPLAMKARVRDLHLRGWEPERISRLLRLSPEQVAAWSDPKQNPILGGEKDPLKVKGERRRKRDKTGGRKGGRTKRKKPSGKRGGPWPPARHLCRKHWTAPEEAYVLQLMESGIRPLVIYRRMRASKSRQMKIWRKFGNEGTPPNFPEPKEPPTGPKGPQLPPAEYKERRDKARALERSADEQLLALEEAAVARQQRIADLEAQAIEEERKIKLLEIEQKQLLTERQEKAKRLAAARAILEKKGMVPPPKKRRVLPESFEAEELGLKPGAVAEPGRPGRPAMPKPKGFGQYADNGLYFPVSKEWADLEDAASDELALFADYLRLKKFPAKVESAGDQPKAYFDSTWPKAVETRWTKAVDGGLALVEKYRARKKKLSSKKMFSKGIAKYLAKGFDAYANADLSEAQKTAAREELMDAWARLKKIDRLILIFGMGVSGQDGTPTSKGIERGRAAKILLEREATSAAKKLAERQQVTRKRQAVRSAEEDEVAAILAGGKETLALPEGDDED